MIVYKFDFKHINIDKIITNTYSASCREFKFFMLEFCLG